jgi:GT2 family glycosyltransferase
MISVLLATTGRPAAAALCVQRLVETAKGHDLEVVAAVDDGATAERLMGCCRWKPGTRLIVDESQTHRGCSKAWNDALARSEGDPVVLAADDLVFTHGWLDAALAKLEEFKDGWGFVGFNDGHWNSELSTHYLMSRRFIVEVLGGVIAWECYKHSFNDCEINERAKQAGRYKWAEDAVVLHKHWTYGERPKDTTDDRWLGDHPESQRIFMQRREQGFPNDYIPAITC